MVYGYYGNMGMYSILGGFFSFLMWILIIILIIWIIRNYSSLKRDDKKDSNSIDILKERYAKGEIEREEFETKRKDLLK